MTILNEWFVFSLILFVIWIIVFIFNKGKKEMLIVSVLTMPFGLTEPLFVPEYWSPPSLFNLALKTGFDIESLIFCFAIGGIGTVAYEIIVKKYHKNIKNLEIKRHKYHYFILFSPIMTFLILFIFTKLNPIYSASIAMFIGGIGTI